MKKIYKLNRPGGSSNEGDDRKELEMLVLGSMALRGATN